jgi:hypothetical protein
MFIWFLHVLLLNLIFFAAVSCDEYFWGDLVGAASTFSYFGSCGTDLLLAQQMEHGLID